MDGYGSKFTWFILEPFAPREDYLTCTAEFRRSERDTYLQMDQ
jgi:hypothetical protein